MKNYCEYPLHIFPSHADFTGKLSVADTFALFMDAASVHSEELKVGIDDMAKKNLFWLTAKCKARFYRRPNLGEECTVTTFPEEPKGLYTVRDYLLKSGDETLVIGKTQWAVLNTETGKPIPLCGIYPAQLATFLPSVFPEPFARIKEAFPTEAFASHIITSADIDIGHHTNNIAYIRILFSLFSVKERKEKEVREMDVIYLRPTYEGDTVFFYKYEENGTLYIKGTVSGQTVILYAIA